MLKNIYPIPILTFFPIPSAQIPVPVPKIPFSQGSKRPIAPSGPSLLCVKELLESARLINFIVYIKLNAIGASLWK